ncbi:HAD-like domain-containing protein [Butyriboletus roseoflavus]|nr:HAD-like domain-containing protein [Butyriboletus roseoflavus]
MEDSHPVSHQLVFLTQSTTEAMVASADHSPTESVEASPIFPPLSPTSVSSLGTPSLEAKPLPLLTHDRQIDNVIFDLGDVLFTWSANTGTSISPNILHSILRSVTWFEYEKGNLDEDETYRLAAAEFSLDSSELGAAFRVARESLQSDPSMIPLLHELKGKFNIRLFAMSNISAPDWEILRHKARPEDWALFERVFTSAAARERKPNLGYFHHVLESTGIDPRRTAFVDDKVENVVSARSLELKGIVFTSFDECRSRSEGTCAGPGG